MRIHTTLAIAAIAAFSAGAAVGCSISGNGPWIDRSDLSGEITTQTRDATGFTGVSLSGDATLTVTQGESFSVEVTADSELQDHIATTVGGSTLRIDQNYSIVGTSPEVTVAITVPRLTDLSLSGSADATVAGIRGDSLGVSTSGSSDIRIDAKVHTLTVDVSGSSDITLTGTARSAEISISGSGTLTGTGFTAASASVDVSGSGGVTTRVEKTLDASVAGSGDITYYGDPEVSSDVAGSGRVHRAGS